MATLSWQAGSASGSYLTGTIIQGLIIVNYPDYEPKAWQGTLLIFAMVPLIYIFNVWGAGMVPEVQTYLLGLHLILFVATIIVLWVRAPHVSAATVFTQRSDSFGASGPIRRRSIHKIFNWSVVIFLGLLVLSLFMYWVRGRHVYDGPVTLVERRQE